VRRNSSIIFDLDGTLIDSKASILKCIKAALDELGIKSLVPITEQLVGPPLAEMLSTICGANSQALISLTYTKFKEIYDKEGFQGGVIYPGVDVLIRQLVEEGYHLSLATNKRRIPTEKILELFDWKMYFNHVYTIDSGSIPFQNKSQMIATLIQNEAIDCGQAVYVGDRHEDSVAATQNNIKFLMVQWGYESKALLNSYPNKINTAAELKIEISKLMYKHTFH
jgi:phosphoglycolate phosphatase